MNIINFRRQRDSGSLTEKHLVEICKQLGGISEGNLHLTHVLAHRIDESGKKLEDMTVGDLLNLSRSVSVFTSGKLPVEGRIGF